MLCFQNTHSPTHFQYRDKQNHYNYLDTQEGERVCHIVITENLDKEFQQLDKIMIHTSEFGEHERRMKRAMVPEFLEHKGLNFSSNYIIT